VSAPKASIPQVSNNTLSITSEQLKAARALLRWDQAELATRSLVSLPTIKRLETKPGALRAHGPTIAALRGALEKAGLEFISESGEGVGVRIVRDGTRSRG
jgi:transcriptional regulator with XRE-family HTH domain